MGRKWWAVLTIAVLLAACERQVKVPESSYLPLPAGVAALATLEDVPNGAGDEIFTKSIALGRTVGDGTPPNATALVEHFRSKGFAMRHIEDPAFWWDWQGFGPRGEVILGLVSELIADEKPRSPTGMETSGERLARLAKRDPASIVVAEITPRRS